MTKGKGNAFVLSSYLHLLRICFLGFIRGEDFNRYIWHLDWIQTDTTREQSLLQLMILYTNICLYDINYTFLILIICTRWNSFNIHFLY